MIGSKVLLVQLLPKGHEGGTIQVPLRPGQGYHVDGPLAHVLIQRDVVPLEVEGADCGIGKESKPVSR